MSAFSEYSGSAPIRLELDAVYRVQDIAVAAPIFAAYPEADAPGMVPGGSAPDILGGAMRAPGGIASIITAIATPGASSE